MDLTRLISAVRDCCNKQCMASDFLAIGHYAVRCHGLRFQASQEVGEWRSQSPRSVKEGAAAHVFRATSIPLYEARDRKLLSECIVDVQKGRLEDDSMIYRKGSRGLTRSS